MVFAHVKQVEIKKKINQPKKNKSTDFFLWVVGERETTTGKKVLFYFTAVSQSSSNEQNRDAANVLSVTVTP
jgi:hypothetical protein